MKLFALASAGLLMATGLATAVPAEAQRYGYDRYDRGYHGDRGWRDGRVWRGDRGWRGDRRWDRGRRYGWNRGGYGWRGDGYRRGRVVCRIERGYYGRERVCFRR